MNHPSKSVDKSLTAVLAAIGIALGAVAGAAGIATPAQAANKPNILVIWGDDIGITNISAYSRGMMWSASKGSRTTVR